MNYTAIHTLLDAHLSTVAGLPSLQRENTRAIPTTGTPYSRSTLLPSEPVRLSSTTNEVNGLFQIDLFYPQDTGTTAAAAMADLITAAFPRGLTLTNDSTSVHVRMAWRDVSQNIQKFYNVQLVVRWACLQPRT